jgi:hypothetical protein
MRQCQPGAEGSFMLFLPPFDDFTLEVAESLAEQEN